MAVLTHGTDGRPLLDNGRGLARINVFRHKHEMQSGRTSSICHQLLGYDAEGRVINYATPAATGECEPFVTHGGLVHSGAVLRVQNDTAAWV